MSIKAEPVVCEYNISGVFGSMTGAEKLVSSSCKVDGKIELPRYPETLRPILATFVRKGWATNHVHRIPSPASFG
jgi:hypothetical protein